MGQEGLLKPKSQKVAQVINWSLTKEGVSDLLSIWHAKPGELDYSLLEACFDTLPYHAARSATVVSLSEFAVSIDTVIQAATADAVRALIYQNAGKKLPKSKSMVQDLKKKQEEERTPERVEEVADRLRNLGMMPTSTPAPPRLEE